MSRFLRENIHFLFEKVKIFCLFWTRLSDPSNLKGNLFFYSMYWPVLIKNSLRNPVIRSVDDKFPALKRSGSETFNFKIVLFRRCCTKLMTCVTLFVEQAGYLLRQGNGRSVHPTKMRVKSTPSIFALHQKSAHKLTIVVLFLYFGANVAYWIPK